MPGPAAKAAVQPQRPRGAGLDQLRRIVDPQREPDTLAAGRLADGIDHATGGDRRLVPAGGDVEIVEVASDGAAIGLEAHLRPDQRLVRREQGRGRQGNPAAGVTAGLAPAPARLGGARASRRGDQVEIADPAPGVGPQVEREIAVGGEAEGAGQRAALRFPRRHAKIEAALAGEVEIGV